MSGTLWEQVQPPLPIPAPTREAAVSMTVLPGLRAGRFLTIQERFEEWLDTPDGRHVYAEVIRRAETLRLRGWRHFAIGALWEAIRYDRSVQVGPENGFKLNDHYRSRMARRVMDDDPSLRGFFETRGLRA